MIANRPAEWAQGDPHLAVEVGGIGFRRETDRSRRRHYHPATLPVAIPSADGDSRSLRVFCQPVAAVRLPLPRLRPAPELFPSLFRALFLLFLFLSRLCARRAFLLFLVPCRRAG